MDVREKADSPVILVVDDEPVMRVLARESLQQFGFEVIDKVLTEIDETTGKATSVEGLWLKLPEED